MQEKSKCDTSQDEHPPRPSSPRGSNKRRSPASAPSRPSLHDRVAKAARLHQPGASLAEVARRQDASGPVVSASAASGGRSQSRAPGGVPPEAPPGWGVKYSAKQNRYFLFKISDPKQTRWFSARDVPQVHRQDHEAGSTMVSSSQPQAAASVRTVDKPPSVATVQSSRDPRRRPWPGEDWLDKMVTRQDRTSVALRKAEDAALERIVAHQKLVIAAQALEGTAAGKAALKSTQDWMGTCANFERTQLERQAAGLRTNLRKSGIEDASQIKSRHHQAIQMMISNTHTVLSVDLLQRVHSVLMNDNPTLSNFRTTGSRCGHQEWCPGALVKPAMDAFVVQANRMLLEDTLGKSKYEEKRTLLRKTALIAARFVQIHPFSDGNGRMSRIICNWALRRAGVPFCICLCSTEAQRSTLIRAHNSAHSHADIEPMVMLLAELLENAWSELSRLYETQTKSAAEAAQSDAIKRAREEARAQSCMICLEDAVANPPNIATLCCGSAVHLNCLAEWLSAAAEPSCVQCRAALPKPKPRPPPPAAPGPGAEADVDSEETFETTTTESDGEVQAPSSPDDYETTTTTDSAEDTTSTVSEQEDTTTSTDDEATTTMPARSPPRPARCTACRNQAAPQCTNNACGRCCVAYGRYSCQRHGT